MAKCKICKQSVLKRDLDSGKGIKLTHKGVNMYFCCEEHCKKHMDELKVKEQFYKDRDDIDRFVKENIFLYFDERKLPNAFFDRISDLANGTDRAREGRIIKNGRKEGYPMSVILETFKTQRDNILYCFRHKNFSKESQKINYMMAIIESNINDVYEAMERQKQMNESFEKNKEDDSISQIGLSMLNVEEPTEPIKQNEGYGFEDYFNAILDF